MIWNEKRGASRAFLLCSAFKSRAVGHGRRRDDMQRMDAPCIGAITHECYMVGMFPDLYQRAARIVIDDHCRLPGRFFGRFTTSIAAELRKL